MATKGDEMHRAYMRHNYTPPPQQVMLWGALRALMLVLLLIAIGCMLAACDCRSANCQDTTGKKATATQGAVGHYDADCKMAASQVNARYRATGVASR